MNKRGVVLVGGRVGGVVVGYLWVVGVMGCLCGWCLCGWYLCGWWR